MSMGDGITWALAAVIFLAFCAGLKRLYRHFVSGESSCCGNGCSAGCAGCTKGEVTAQERKQAAEAWQAIRAEARKHHGDCAACRRDSAHGPDR